MAPDSVELVASLYGPPLLWRISFALQFLIAGVSAWSAHEPPFRLVRPLGFKRPPLQEALAEGLLIAFH